MTSDQKILRAHSSSVPHAVSITLRTPLRNLAVYVGNTRPSRDQPPSKALTLCVARTGTVGTSRGEVVKFSCRWGPLEGRFVAVQIR